MKESDLKKAFVDIIQQHERIIYKVCSFYTSPDMPIADLYQDVVYNLWAGFRNFRNECSVSSWIYRVALNTCISGLRKEKKTPKGNVLVESLSESLSAPECLNENICEMYRLINRLKTLEKAVVLLYLEEKSYQEIADIMGLSVSNVATKLKRSRVKLKQMSNL